MFDHVQVRLYWLIMFWQDFIEKLHVKDRIAACFIYINIRHAMVLASLMNDFKTF